MPDNPSVSSVVDSKTPALKSADDIFDSFKELDVKDDSKKVPSDDNDDKDDKDDGLKLIEPDDDEEKLDLKADDDDDEEKEVKVDADEEIEIDAPPKKREILKKYPEVFKDFPFLEKILYRDKQYTELFGSYDDAKEIADKAEIFSTFENQLLSGDTVEILKNVKEADSKAFDTIVDNYLLSLSKVDKDAYFEVVGNINKRLIAEMVKEANDTGNDDMKQAALIVNQFLFNSSKMQEFTRRVDKTNTTEKNEVEQERLNLVKERFESARDDLQSRIDNTLKATISEYIDRKGSMTAYVKKNAIADALRITNSVLSEDSSVGKNLNRLWRNAFDAKFSKESMSKIQSYYLTRAKPALASAIAKARAEALKDMPPRERKEKETVEEDESSSSSSRRLPPGRTSPPNKSKNEMRKGESVADFFARD